METSTSSPEWQTWLGEYAGRLLLFARQQSRNAADAEDLLQEALVEAWSRVNNGGPPPVSLVYSTVRRRAIDRARAEDGRRKREEVCAAGEALWFDTSMVETETCKLVEGGVKALQPIYAEVVTLKIWGELTFEEIAGVLDIPANTAASRYRYGLEALRKNLKDVIR